MKVFEVRPSTVDTLAVRRSEVSQNSGHGRVDDWVDPIDSVQADVRLGSETGA